MDLRRSQLPLDPEPGADLRRSDRFLGQIDPVARSELPGGQCRSKIGVLLARDPDYPAVLTAVQLVVAWEVEAPGDEANRTVLRESLNDPSKLSARESKSLSGSSWLQISVDHSLNTLPPIQIPHRECHSAV